MPRTNILNLQRLFCRYMFALSLSLLITGSIEAQTTGQITYVYDEMGRLVAAIDPSINMMRLAICSQSHDAHPRKYQSLR